MNPRPKLRKVILAELKSMIAASAKGPLIESVNPKRFAQYITDTYLDMFNEERYIDSQIENHVYWELIERGYMTDENPDLDLLEAVMDELAAIGVLYEGVISEGVISEDGSLTGAINFVRRALRTYPDNGRGLSQSQKVRFARNVVRQYPQFSQSEALEAVETAIDQITGGQDLTLKQKIAKHLPMDPGVLKQLAEPGRHGHNPKLGALTQKLWRSGDFPGIEPSVLYKTIQDVVSDVLQKRGLGEAKRQDLATLLFE